MPSNYCGDKSYIAKARQLAERQVAEKFPDLPKGSGGWYRAVQNRFKRIVD